MEEDDSMTLVSELKDAKPIKVSRYMPVIVRVFAQSKPVDSGCIEWQGKLNQHGYGVTKKDGKEIRAHRLIYFEMNPASDQSLNVLHHCDNRKCINPYHLYLGTQQENMRDMAVRGRARGGAKPGNRNSVGNKGWLKKLENAGYDISKYVARASKLGYEVPDE